MNIMCLAEETSIRKNKRTKYNAIPKITVATELLESFLRMILIVSLVPKNIMNNPKTTIIVAAAK